MAAKQEIVRKRVSEIDGQLYFLSVRALEYELFILEKKCDILEKKSFDSKIIKQKFRFIIEIRDEMLKSKNELECYKAHTDCIPEIEKINSVLSYVKELLETTNKSIKGIERIFGAEYKEKTIVESFKPLKELSLNAKSQTDRQNRKEGLHPIFFILLIILGAILYFLF